MAADFNQFLEKDIEIIENALDKYLQCLSTDYKIVCDAMSYSVKNGGKKLRPVLVLEFCKVCGGDISKALPFACAIEMIHTYSLIHDDLPCMDDDDMRRGRPSCHIAFGEEYALLAGDALLTKAFEIATTSTASPDVTLRAIRELAQKSGVGGMIGGQVMDLLNEGKNTSLETLKEIHLLKTGALIECAATIGCIVANADEEKVQAAKTYAQSIGLAFQIMDDILDVTGDCELLGKPVGSDKNNEKSTYVSILGLEVSTEMVEKLTDFAKESLDVFENEAEFLKQLADSLKSREK